MTRTCVHDLLPKRFINSLVGEVIRCYPVSMTQVDDDHMPVRHVVVSDCSGWVPVKLWGQDAMSATQGQVIELHNAWCYQRGGDIWLSVGRHSWLTFRTQP